MDVPINKFEADKTLLLSCIGILFLILYLLLSFHNRPIATDDFKHLYWLNEYGFGEMLQKKYTEWTCRWAAFISFNALFSISDDLLKVNKAIFLYHLTTIIIFIYSIYSLITSIFDKYFIKKPPLLILLNYSIIFCAAFFFISFQIGESWFWLTVSFLNIQSIVMCCLGFAFIIKSKFKLLHIIIIAFSFTYVGGAIENYSFVSMILLLGLLTYILIHQQYKLKLFFRNQYVQKLIIAFIFLASSTAITYSSPGISNRLEFIAPQSPNLTPPLLVYISLKTFVLSFFKIKNVCFVFLALTCIILGNFMKRNNRKSITINKDLLLKSTLLLFALSALSLLPLIYAFKNLGHQRAWTQVAFFITIYTCLWSFLIGYHYKIPYKWNNILYYCTSSICIILLSIYIYRQYPAVSCYAKAYDQRISYLYKLRETDNMQTITLKRLPPSGMLVGADISGAPGFHKNIYLQKILKLNFKIRVE